jgi:hypothetical protein
VLHLRIEIPNVGISYQHYWASHNNALPRAVRLLDLLHGSDKNDNRYINSVRLGLGAKGLQKVIFVLLSQFQPCGGNNVPVQLEIATLNDLDDYAAQNLAKQQYNPIPVPGSGFLTTSDIMDINEGGELKNLTRYLVFGIWSTSIVTLW